LSKEIPIPLVSEIPHIPSEEAEFFNVSGGGDDYPKFIKEIMVDSLEVEIGDNQCFSVWVEDPNEVEEVLIKIDTDSEIKSFNMELIEGTKKEGKWFICWEVESISVSRSYRSYFWAIGQEGEKNITTIIWQTK